MRWWHATPDVIILMFYVSILFVLFVMMLWSLLRCNKVWVYTYLREEKKTKDYMLNAMKMLLLFVGEEVKTPTLAQLPRWRWRVIIRPLPGWAALQVRGQGSVRYGGTSLLFLQWQVRITVSPALLLSCLSSMCSQDFNCKEDKRKQATLCYESALPPKIRDLDLFGLL